MELECLHGLYHKGATAVTSLRNLENLEATKLDGLL